MTTITFADPFTANVPSVGLGRFGLTGALPAGRWRLAQAVRIAASPEARAPPPHRQGGRAMPDTRVTEERRRRPAHLYTICTILFAAARSSPLRMNSRIV